MKCRICQIGSAKITEAIEERLLGNAGVLFTTDKEQLA